MFYQYSDEMFYRPLQDGSVSVLRVPIEKQVEINFEALSLDDYYNEELKIVFADFCAGDNGFILSNERNFIGLRVFFDDAATGDEKFFFKMFSKSVGELMEQLFYLKVTKIQASDGTVYVERVPEVLKNIQAWYEYALSNAPDKVSGPVFERVYQKSKRIADAVSLYSECIEIGRAIAKVFMSENKEQENEVEETRLD